LDSLKKQLVSIIDNPVNAMSSRSVSIAMATCNGAKYLCEQLESFLSQERKPDELVVTDDCSEDGTLAILERFTSRAPFTVRIVRNTQKLGFNRNFEKGITLCTGRVILCSDQDDVWLSPHVRRLVEPFEGDPQVGIVVSNSAYTDESLRPTGIDLFRAERFAGSYVARARGNPQFPAWVRHHVIAGHGTAIHADLRSAALPFGHNWTYDQWLALISVAFLRGIIIDEPLTLHRMHGKQANANRKLTLLQSLSQTPALHVEHFDNEMVKWRELLERLERPHRLRLRGDVLTAVRARLQFLEHRRSIRRHGVVSRIWGTVRRLVIGDYHRYGRGWLTFARDMMG
jgi:glycosyltransferase involved in cell wall biosynthesis